VPSSIRKLPGRSRAASSNGDAASIGGVVTLARGVSAQGESFVGGLERAGDEPAAGGMGGARESQPTPREGSGEAAEVRPAPTAAAPPPPPAPLATATGVPLAGPLLSAARKLEPSPRARTRASSAIEPLSPERYKIVFTADAVLKRKLELARDLLRHAVPSGDLATIMGRALDLLIDETSRRRFAKTGRSKAARSRSQASGPASATIGANDVGLAVAAGEVATTATESEPRTKAPPRSTLQVSGPAAATIGTNDVGLAVLAGKVVAPVSTTASENEPETSAESAAASAKADGSAPPAPLTAPTGSRPSRHLPSRVRRAVVERDGLRCTWHGPDGTRCESRAWLEHDHIDPRGKGGGDDPSNIQIRCHAHNLLAAEQTYGRRTIAQIIARRRGRQHLGVETHDDLARAPAGSRPTP